MSQCLISFDTGLREQIDENTEWHGHGWLNFDGSLRLPVDPDTDMIIEPTGSLTVRHDGQKVW